MAAKETAEATRSRSQTVLLRAVCLAQNMVRFWSKKKKKKKFTVSLLVRNDQRPNSTEMTIRQFGPDEKRKKKSRRFK